MGRHMTAVAFTSIENYAQSV